MAYQTSPEGLKEIREDLLRQTPLEKLERIIVRSPGDTETQFNLLKIAYENALKAREDFIKKPEKYKNRAGKT